MPQSLARLCVHLVFSTKHREPFLRGRIRADLHAYMAAVRRYIAEREEHHRRIGFQDEYRAFLTKHNVAFDERHVWD